MSVNNNMRTEFSAVLERIENVAGRDNTKAYYFKNIRRKGVMMRPSLLMMQQGNSGEFSNVQPGDSVLLHAYIELLDIKLTSPHIKMSKKINNK